MFSEAEIAYLQSQPLARLATGAPNGQPDVAPVGYRFDGRTFTIGGRDIPSTRKYKNIQAGNARVALVVDDLETVDPWRPRGIKVFGRAEIIEHGAGPGPGPFIRINPEISWSWGIEGPVFVKGDFITHRVVRNP